MLRLIRLAKCCWRERSEAMQRWLVDVNPQSYTLQITCQISSNEIDDVGRVLRRLQQADLLDNTLYLLVRQSNSRILESGLWGFRNSGASSCCDQ